MALDISDPELDELMAEAQRLTGAATRTDVVKNALKKEIETGVPKNRCATGWISPSNSPGSLGRAIPTST